MKRILSPCLVFCLLLGLFFACSREENRSDTSLPGAHTNSFGMEFVLILPGSFIMGCNKYQESCLYNETPQHQVTITQPFYLGKYEVTQVEWAAVMGNNPSQYKGTNHPVENVSWEDAQEFVRGLNRREGTEKYRLPTEAEWEYAARAGGTASFHAGSLRHYAWYDGASGSGTHPVGQKQPNPWGLYDMHGNVWEWVQDWHGDYAGQDLWDPQGPDSGTSRVLRGGGWNSLATACRPAYRRINKPDYRNEYYGFRLAFSPDQ